MLYYENPTGTFTLWSGQVIDGVRHPPTIEASWTAEELAAVGLYSPQIPNIPNGKHAVSESVQRVDGIVKFVYVLEDDAVEQPSDFTLNRIQFEFIITKLGLDVAIDAAIDAMPETTEDEINAKIMARVLRNFGQSFRRDHPLFTDLATAIGITAEQIDYMWMLAKDI